MYKVDDITVLIATKDRVDEIQRAIQSSLNQTIKANIVVLDDASKINIREELESQLKDKPVKCAILKPTRSLYEDGELFYSVELSKYIQAGMLTKTLLERERINTVPLLAPKEKLGQLV